MVGAEPMFFATPADFRRWLEAHHDDTPELLVGFYKRAVGKPSITWPESVDAALCFGWIDGVRKSIDGDSYTIRFTPRKARSTWSAVNIRRFGELVELGLVHPAGQAAFERRTEDRSGIYSYEQRGEAELGPEYERQLRANEAAWAYFQAQPGSYRKAATWWVVSAKKEETRVRRLGQLIEYSAQGNPIPQFIRPIPKT